MTPILSILICSLKKREKAFRKLIHHLQMQIVGLGQKAEFVEIIIDVDSGEQSTGAKRNGLLQSAKGKMVVFIDDDDWVDDYYIHDILKAAESDPDAIGICGWMTTNGSGRVEWYISKDNGYCAAKDSMGNTIYQRWNNHISPIRAEIAKQFSFEDIYFGEDYKWSKAIHASGLIKTEVVIDRPLYHYDYWQIK